MSPRSASRSRWSGESWRNARVTTSTWPPDASPAASASPSCGIAVVVAARSKLFDASVNAIRAASAATRSGNIDGDSAASSLSRRAAAISIESSQPRTRRTSPNAVATAP